MRLVFLHGPPAAGKYTLGAGLQQRTGGRFLHNHLTLDVAKAVVAFGTPAFWQLVERLRLAAVEAACLAGESLLICTACYAEPDDVAFLSRLEALLERTGGVFVPIYVQASRAERHARVGSAERVAMGKVRTPDGLDRFEARYNCVPIPRPTCQRLETSGRSPQACLDALEAMLDG